MTSRKIYLASSWRNRAYPGVLLALREAGHEVYDFREDGFAWSEIDPEWGGWTPRRYVQLLDHPRAQQGFGRDKAALDWCDTCVLLLPCGRSAHLEAGYAVGRGKRTVILLDESGFEPELMYLFADRLVCDAGELILALRRAA